MNIVSLGSLSILVFAALILVGGIIGFKKAKSKASLIAGVVSAIALAGSYLVCQQEQINGIRLTIILICILEGIFLVRFIKTKKFMPSGLMLLFCLTEQVILSMLFVYVSNR